MDWFERRLALRAATLSGMCSLAGATLVVLFLQASVARVPLVYALLSIFGSGLAAAVVTFVIVEGYVSQRLRAMAKFADDEDGSSDLVRLPRLGEDELGEAAEAFNRLLARQTSLRVSVMDTNRELAEAREKLTLQEALAEKSRELQARLRERAIVFDLLHVSVTETELSNVITKIAERVSTDLGMRETAIVIKEGKNFVIRAALGFHDPQGLMGRVVDPESGVTGRAAKALKPILVEDVTAEPEYLSFWGHAKREGSFAAVPIVYQGALIGVLATTRATGSPFSEGDLRLLSALADQAALAIRHAQLFEEMRALSTTDELTGLPNRRLLSRRLEHEVDRARRFGKPVALLAVDIDHFKQLNDTLGHGAGDVALKAVADAMQQTVRRVDTVARTGGEEFIVLLAETDLDEARIVADKIRAHIELRDVPGEQALPGGKLTISVGVARLRDNEDANSLLTRADEALYAAKRRGRNRVVAWEDGVSLAPPEPAPSRPPIRM